MSHTGTCISALLCHYSQEPGYESSLGVQQQTKKKLCGTDTQWNLIRPYKKEIMTFAKKMGETGVSSKISQTEKHICLICGGIFKHI